MNTPSSRIDPRDEEPSSRPFPVGSSPSGIAVGSGDVWVANRLDGTVSRIDLDDDREVQKIPVGNGPTGVGYAEGAGWVANGRDGTLPKIDAEQRARP